MLDGGWDQYGAVQVGAAMISNYHTDEIVPPGGVHFPNAWLDFGGGTLEVWRWVMPFFIVYQIISG